MGGGGSLASSSVALFSQKLHREEELCDANITVLYVFLGKLGNRLTENVSGPFVKK